MGTGIRIDPLQSRRVSGHFWICWHLDTHKPMGLDGIHPRILRELVGATTKPFHSLSLVLAHWGSPRQLEIGQCDSQPQERLEGGSRELETCQPDISAREGYGTNYQDNQGADPNIGLDKAGPA